MSLPAQQRESAAVVRSFDDRVDCPHGVSGRVDFCALRHFPTQSHLAKVDETNQRCLGLRGIENGIRHLSGVTGVTNNIALKARPKAADVREQIRKELARTVNQDVNDIDIETSNGDVTLRGTVSSWTEDEAARRASWSVPGVTKVEDHLVVG